MLQRLIARSEPLRRLRDEGYAIALSPSNNHLIVSHVPYVNASREVRYGTLVAVLNLNGDLVNPPPDHVVYFTGDQPCEANGAEITAIKHAMGRQEIDKGLFVDRSFSAKPTVPFADYYAKMTNYVNILAGPAHVILPAATAKISPPYPITEEEAVFRYADTSSSRSGIAGLAERFERQLIGIVGVGGTGSYVLDFIAKTPVAEIHLFDSDIFSSHNAFRAPGAASLQELEQFPRKTAYFDGIYAKMRRGLYCHDEVTDGAGLDVLAKLDFVFLCLDQGKVKELIVTRLLEARVPFVDVGMGLEHGDGFLTGLLRVTTASGDKSDHVRDCIPFTDGGANDIYGKNIQVAEMNALNAALAVIRWKKLLGFYRDLEGEHSSHYSVSHGTILNQHHHHEATDRIQP